VLRGLPGHWIANESPGVLPYDALPKLPGEALHNVLRKNRDLSTPES
jgi:hypothetical protein